MKYTTKKLVEQLDAGVNLKFLHFWGHKRSNDGSLSKSCFSQWWDQHPFEYENIIYPTAEHWMMAGKARLFDDQEILERILTVSTAAEAKKLGRRVRNFNQKLWEQERFFIVKKGNILKFGQHQELKDFILNTTARILVEASPVDAIWGNGHAITDPIANNPRKWRGLNLLGFALMEARDELK